MIQLTVEDDGVTPNVFSKLKQFPEFGEIFQTGKQVVQVTQVDYHLGVLKFRNVNKGEIEIMEEK